MAHYAYIYFQNVSRLLNADDSMNRVEIIVPTGACGNITGIHIIEISLAKSLRTDLHSSDNPDPK